VLRLQQWAPATALHVLGQVVPLTSGRPMAAPIPAPAAVSAPAVPIRSSTASPTKPVKGPSPVPFIIPAVPPTSVSPCFSSSEDENDEEFVPDVDEACEGSDEEAFYDPTECPKCAKLWLLLLKDPKNKLGKLSEADQKLTDDMYAKYLEQNTFMDSAQKASHIDLYFKLRDIKALRKMVGIHNKSHSSATKPRDVESTTRLLGQKYILTRVCVEDISIPFRKFLKAKKAAGRSKPSRSARQARKDKDETTQTKSTKAKGTARYQPY